MKATLSPLALLLLIVSLSLGCNVSSVPIADDDAADDDATYGDDDSPTVPGTENNCTDGVDNDQDGSTDCQDLDCSNAPACQQPTPPNGFGNNVSGTITMQTNWDAAAQVNYGLPVMSTDVLTVTGSSPAPGGTECVSSGCFKDWTVTISHTTDSTFFDLSTYTSWNSMGVTAGTTGTYQTIFYDASQGGWVYFVEENGTPSSWSGMGSANPINDPTYGYLGTQTTSTSFQSW